MSEESMRNNRARKTNNIQAPTTSKHYEKRTSLQAGRFLKSKHPELFEIKPLPGGYRRRLDLREDTRKNPIENEASGAKVSPSTAHSRSERGASISDILGSNIRCPNTRRALSKDDRNNNMIKMCSIAISTVMMMAQQSYDDITMEHVRHTEEYFRGLKQPDGYPANVGQLMQLLTNIKNNGSVISTVNDHENDDEGKSKEQEPETSTNEQKS